MIVTVVECQRSYWAFDPKIYSLKGALLERPQCAGLLIRASGRSYDIKTCAKLKKNLFALAALRTLFLLIVELL